MLTTARSRILVACLCTSVCAAQAAEILLVKNASEPEFDDPMRMLNTRLSDKHQLEVIDLTGLDKPASVKKLAARRQTATKLVIALGDRAAYLVNKELASLPFLFAMVPSWEALGLSRERGSGISMQLEPETMASHIKLFLPARRRIGVVYTTNSKGFVERAMQKAASTKMTLIPVFVEKAEEFDRSMESIMGMVDIFWLVEDPELVTAKNLKALRKVSAAESVPVVTWSPRLVRGGLTMAIALDRLTVGTQLADMVEKVLGGAAVKDLPVEAPQKALITLNRQAMDRLSIQLDPMLMSFARIVDTKSAAKRKGGRRARQRGF